MVVGNNIRHGAILLSQGNDSIGILLLLVGRLGHWNNSILLLLIKNWNNRILLAVRVYHWNNSILLLLMMRGNNSLLLLLLLLWHGIQWGRVLLGNSWG